MLTSPANPLVKDVRKAISNGGLTERGYVIAETFHLLDEALRSGLDIKAVLEFVEEITPPASMAAASAP